MSDIILVALVGPSSEKERNDPKEGGYNFRSYWIRSIDYFRPMTSLAARLINSKARPLEKLRADREAREFSSLTKDLTASLFRLNDGPSRLARPPPPDDG